MLMREEREEKAKEKEEKVKEKADSWKKRRAKKEEDRTDASFARLGVFATIGPWFLCHSAKHVVKSLSFISLTTIHNGCRILSSLWLVPVSCLMCTQTPYRLDEMSIMTNLPL